MKKKELLRRRFLHMLFILCVVSSMASEVVAQNVSKLKGVVTGDDGYPVIGANVTVKGTTVGTITDFDGNYTIEAEKNATLVFSYIGYITQEIKLKGETVLNVLLKEDVQALGEVVVIGYGDTRKSDLSVAVSSMKISDGLKGRSQSLEGMMQGQLPGVTIASNGGDPISSPSITIRGKGSRDGDKVLYIVDGVPGAPFNAEDVESISVLKDAASAAIYGAHVGSGGVIVITTKKAQAGKVKVDANIYYGIQQVYKKPEMLDAAQYARVRTDAAIASGKSIPTGLDPEIYGYGQTTRTNWLDEIFRLGSTQHYAASITGGSETLKAFASVSYDKLEGTLLNTHREKLGANVNIEFKVNNWLTFAQRASYQYMNGQGGVNTTSHTGVIASAMAMPPSATVYEYDINGNPVLGVNGQHQFGGTVPLWAKELGVAGTFGEIQNPVATLMRLRQNRPDQRIFSTSTLTAKPITGLTIKSDFSAASNTARSEDFKMRVPEIGNPNNQNSRGISSSWGTNWLWETTATYTREFNEKHLFTGMLGYTMGYENYRSNSVRVYGFDQEDDWAQSVVNGTDWTKEKPSEEFWENSQVSTFGRVSYSYEDRYFLTGSLRYDATSKLYYKNNSGVFPAASASWKLSSEKFFPKQSAVSLLKLRASWGQIGNVAAVDNYSYNVKLQQDPWFTFLGNAGQTPIQGLGLATMANRNLTWEASEQIDLGLDANFFNDQLNFTFDYFVKDTKDLIDQITVPSVGGIKEAPLGNIGSVRNSGIEMSLSYNGKVDQVNYTLTGNFSTLKNEVTSLGDKDRIAHTQNVRSLAPLQSAVGEAWYSYYLIKSDGLFRSQEEIDAYAKDGKLIQPNAQPGDIKFVDANGDGVIDDQDRMYMGSYNPTYTFSLSGSMDWKGFDFGFQLQGVAGNKIFNGSKAMTYPADQGWNISKDLLDSYTYNPNSNIPRLAMDDKNSNYSRVSDFYLEKGNYLRLKNLTVGYTLPKSVLTKVGCPDSRIRVYASCENLFTLTKYSGMDPEVGNNGLDGGRYPVSRVFTFGLNVNF